MRSAPVVARCAALLSLCWSLAAASPEIPPLKGRVNDNANLLSSSSITMLEQALKAHEDSTSNQVVILTISDLPDNTTIEEYALAVAREWRLGQAGKDNGVLLVVARNDRKVRIEVGRGLEGALTDALAGTIIRHEIIPQFKAGDYGQGIESGTMAILSAIAGEYTATEQENEGEQMPVFAMILAGTVFLLTVGLFTTIAMFSSGGGSWFLYAFLLPFWGVFPWGFLGSRLGLPIFGTYAVGFPILHTILMRTPWGKKHMLATSGGSGGSFWSSSGSSGSSWSSSSSSSSSFSGGGGSFSGGGSSGSW